MAAIELLKSSNLILVNCQISEDQIKAGWAFSMGALPPVIEFEDYKISIPDFLQKNPTGGELFFPNDTVDFMLVND